MTARRRAPRDPIDGVPVFASRMRQARLRMGIPQDKLGVSIGIDEHSASARISRYESGIHEPPVATARLLAAALRVPLPYLYCDDDLLAELILLSHELSEQDRFTAIRLLQERAEKVKALKQSLLEQVPAHEESQKALS